MVLDKNILNIFIIAGLALICWYLMSFSSLLVPPSSKIRVENLAGEATERRVARSNVAICVMIGCLGV